MSRIAISDDLVTALQKMSEGNPGAINVIMQLVEKTDELYVGQGFAPFECVSRLDKLAIYGPSIWILYKDICHQRIELVFKMLHANVKGILSDADINKSILCSFPTESVKEFLASVA